MSWIKRLPLLKNIVQYAFRCRLLGLIGLVWVNIPGYAGGTEPIVIATDHVALVYEAADNGRLYQVHFGERLDDQREYGKNQWRREAYIASGLDNLLEPAIRVIHGDKNPSLELLYVDHKTGAIDKNVGLTTITLKDPVYDLYVKLNFKTFSSENVIETWTEIRHNETSPVTLTAFASSMLHLNAKSYWLTQFHGAWFGEMNVAESKLTSGIKVIDSKLGTKATIFQSPNFIISLDNPGSEQYGQCIAGTLGWSGNFKLAFEQDEQNSLRIISGINSFASDYQLRQGQTFQTPAFVFTFSNKGAGLASRNLKRWGLNYGVLDGKRDRLTLLNNWEATFFDFDERKLTRLISDASQLGLDLFLLDDGWFGNKYPRDNDGSSLGDWEVNKKKLPHGLRYLSKEASGKGIKFGIWIEPEMVNPKSELYEKHPDWVLRLPNRKEDVSRNQLVLDLANPEVQDFIYATLTGLLQDNPGIGYIKWDCNRMMSSQYSPFLKDDQSHLFIEYARGLYTLLERFRKKYPSLPMMLCSSGGGRVDYGALRYFTEFWPSDNTNAFDRIFIQWGYSFFFPASTVCSHVTSAGNQSIKFKTDVAMSGKLGFDLMLDHLNDHERLFCKNAIKEYKRISDVIWYGDLFRLVSPYETEHAVTLSVDSTKNHAILFVYNLHPRHNDFNKAVRLEGLNAQTLYQVDEINLFPGTKTQFALSATYSGDYLMKVGIPVTSNEPLSSHVFELKSIKQE